MSADDQAFLDALNAVPTQLKRFSGDITEYVEEHLDRVAALMRETLSSSQWIPESARPKLPPKPVITPKGSPLSFVAQAQDWILKHKLVTGAVVVGLGVSVFIYRKRRAYGRKRRAKRASNGARVEVVVIAGSPSEPIVRSIALDLERRGFIVLVVCHDVEEEVLVQNEARGDIKPLMVDVSDPQAAATSVERLTRYLKSPQFAFEGARPHHLILTSLIVVPSLTYPSAPIATIPAHNFFDLLNTRLLHPILLTQAFLPLLSSSPLPHPHHYQHPAPPAPRILVLTPSIISSLNPPFHAPESMITAALTAFTQSLTSELKPLGLPVMHLQLGSFDLSSFYSKSQHHTLQSQRAETLTWPQGAREVYGENFMNVAKRGVGSFKGSPLRELHNAVFDSMARKHGGTCNVGRGSVTYGFVGAWVPRGLVGWMMGMRKMEQPLILYSNEIEESPRGSESEYVSIYARGDNE